ncbi:hypothetical protein LOTGIDRAFT_159845 [Lottia gigantea]|uniref:BHLH domain-containing protein n=1 Tax=Lottia gigantea TaxID=225164 RepID=V4ANT9_LOTGI|nr:hypothetical protein LOTGIDRAFT_159845 [Lottia gigantea]ESO96435.1 hypothetical protein LOTGIDRAFT_159845 [Lottia gigantea]
MEATEITTAPDTKRKSGRLSQQEKYNFRTSSLVSRVQSERKRNQPKQPKPKSRPPPLSKYRRKTANHRERERMQDMNDAFEALRKAVPGPGESDPKQTKVTTLKLALDYIAALRNVLGYGCDSSESDTASSSRGSEFSEQSSNADNSQCEQMSCDILNSDGESSSLSMCGVSSSDESSSNNELDFTTPFDLGDDLCIDFDVDVALML